MKGINISSQGLSKKRSTPTVSASIWLRVRANCHRMTSDQTRPSHCGSISDCDIFSLIMVCQTVLLCHPQSQNLYFEHILVVIFKNVLLTLQEIWFMSWLCSCSSSAVFISHWMIGNHTLDMLWGGKDQPLK